MKAIVVLLLLLVSGRAFALDQGQAYAQVSASVAAYIASCTPNVNNNYTCPSSCVWFSVPGASVGTVYGRAIASNVTCPTSGLPSQISSSYYAAQASYSGLCSARSALSSGWSSAGNGSYCDSGCGYGGSASGDTMTVAGKTYLSLAGLTPSGSVCGGGDGSSNSSLSSDDCTVDGTLTQCVKADGTHCASASNGTQFCWDPSEAGVKTASSGNEAAVKSAASASINAPANAPANGGDWSVNGQSTMSTTSGGTTTTYNVTSMISTYGKSGTGSGTGAASSGDSDSGSGSGDGDDDGSGDDYGSGAATSDLYTKSDKTVTGILDQFMEDAMGTPAVSAINDFMEVPSGGTCPVFSLSASKYWNAMTYDGHCSGDFLTFLQAAGYLILAIASYFAIRIAVN